MQTTRTATTATERLAALIDLAAEHDEPLDYLELVTLLEAERQQARLCERRGRQERARTTRRRQAA